MRAILVPSKAFGNRLVLWIIAVMLTTFWAATSFASWSAAFNENGIYGTTTYSITKIEVFNLSGTSTFENTGMSGFTAGVWTTQLLNANYVLATNPTPGVSNFGWTFSFSGTSADPLHLAYLVYANTGEIFGTYIDGNSGSWSFPDIQSFNPNDPAYNRTPTAPVPIPPAALLFGAGLLSLVGLRKKIISHE